MTIGGIVTEVKEVTTKKGDRMAFLRVEDLSGSVEIVVFAELYRKAREAITSDKPLLIIGRLDKEGEDVKIVANDIALLEDAGKMDKKVKTRSMHVHADGASITADKLTALKTVFEAAKGASPVILHMYLPPDREVVLGLPEELKVNPLDETMKAKLKELIDGAEIKIL